MSTGRAEIVWKRRVSAEVRSVSFILMRVQRRLELEEKESGSYGSEIFSKGVRMELSSKRDLHWPRERCVGNAIDICFAAKLSHIAKSFARPRSSHPSQKEKDRSEP